MNTQERLFLLTKFSSHIDQKLKKIQQQKQANLKIIQNHNIDFDTLPKIDILNDLTLYYEDINSTITSTCASISSVMKNLQSLKNRKQNTATLQDALASISMVRQYSITLKVDTLTNLTELHKALSNYFQIRDKAKYCESYIKEVDQQIEKIEVRYKKEFDAELTKTNSECIKDLSKVLEVIKSNKKRIVTQQKHSLDNHKRQPNHSQPQPKLNSIKPTQSLSQISQFYVSMVKKQLSKFQQQLFNIPIISPNVNQASYLFFDIIKNSLKTIASIIETYSTNIIKLQSLQGLHQVIVHVFAYVMENLVYQILAREKKYFEIDKITISRNKLAIKAAQYKVLKNYFKEFNAIWNQVQRFKTHLFSYLSEKQYPLKDHFSKQLNDITNSSKFVDFNYQIILYFQAFFRHQLDRLIKKHPFILSLWQFEEGFFKQVKQKNDYKTNLTGQQFIQQMITKFTQGIKKSFQTLNILIISALINFINHHLIYQDSFYTFNQLLTRFIGKISSDPKAIEGIMIVMNIVNTYPKAVKAAFEQVEIPQQLPVERVKNEVAQLVHNCKEKTGEFIVDTFDKILNQQFILQKLTSPNNGYQQIITKLFPYFQKDLLQLFLYKMSKVHVQLILQQQFKEKYSHMEVLSLQKEIRGMINFYEGKSHSIRENFRKVLDYIEVLLMESEGGLKKLVEEWKGKYDQGELRSVWKLRTGN